MINRICAIDRKEKTITIHGEGTRHVGDDVFGYELGDVILGNERPSELIYQWDSRGRVTERR